MTEGYPDQPRCEAVLEHMHKTGLPPQRCVRPRNNGHLLHQGPTKDQRAWAWRGPDSSPTTMHEVTDRTPRHLLRFTEELDMPDDEEPKLDEKGRPENPVEGTGTAEDPLRGETAKRVLEQMRRIETQQTGTQLVNDWLARAQWLKSAGVVTSYSVEIDGNELTLKMVMK